MMGWKKLGLVFAPPGTELMHSHAMLPTPLVLPDRIRIYLACCDVDLRGRIFRLDVAREDPRRIIEVDSEPVLDLGVCGSFDADGVNPSQIVARDGRLFLYYIGWQRVSPDIPYRLFAGLAVSDDGGKRFQRHSKDPILPPTKDATLFRTAPHVFPCPHGWGMLYIGGGEFFSSSAGKRLPTYSLCYTTSPDGVRWSPREGVRLLEPNRAQGEIGFGRPVVWHEGAEARLYLSVRTESGYRMVALDGEAAPPSGWPGVLGQGTEAWDAEMTCFGAPCLVGNTEYIFYNGNQFGRAGFGVAMRPAQVSRPGSVLSLIENLTTSRASHL
jgi:hypothetical protein